MVVDEMKSPETWTWLDTFSVETKMSNIYRIVPWIRRITTLGHGYYLEESRRIDGWIDIDRWMNRQRIVNKETLGTDYVIMTQKLLTHSTKQIGNSWT